MTGVVVVETTTLPGSPATRPEPAPARRVRPVRGLPNGRAVVGALLIVAAAVATFVAYLDATSAPVTRYVVATAAVEPGTRLTSLEVVGERFGTIALDLPPEVAGAVVPGGEVEDLVGRVVLAPLAAGDVLSLSHLVEDGRSAGVQSLSFALPRWSAVGGSLRAGERIDVLATYGSGEAAYTAFVVRGVPLLDVAAPDGGSLADAGEVTLTVAVSALEDVQALAHAVSTAELLVTRSATDSDRGAAPGAYRPQPTAEGPRPEPSGGDDARQDG